jgi:hypothetical protein
MMILAGCASSSSQTGQPINEPAGWQTQSVDSQPRDLYQQPYPGTKPLGTAGALPDDNQQP